MLGIVAEAVPTTATSVASPAVAVQAHNDALDFSPQLANAVLSSTKLAELLDTPADEAFVATNAVAAP